MRELALHLLDIIENSVRAEATIIRISVSLDKSATLLKLCVEDDGPGLPVTPENALNPFYTTKKGKRTGLGLSLFRAAAQQAGGDLTLSGSEWGGAKVEALFQYNHLDRAPLGDVADSIKGLALTHPETVWICSIEGPEDEQILILQDFILNNPDKTLFHILEEYAEAIRKALWDAGINTG